tara:strand:- start:655 stop:927 length:273 start_codon:yes stop_codon:yes gene_type:complete
MAKKRSAINFRKTIFGIEITENGIQSFGKSVKLGPIQLSGNIGRSGILGSVAIPGTGISKRRIKLADLPDFNTPDLPEHKNKPDMWTEDE